MQLMDWIFITTNVCVVTFCATLVAILKITGIPNEKVVSEVEEEDFDPFVQKFTENPNVRRKVEKEEVVFDEVDLDEPEHESGKW